jgi:hypothetical protein
MDEGKKITNLNILNILEEPLNIIIWEGMWMKTGEDNVQYVGSGVLLLHVCQFPDVQCAVQRKSHLCIPSLGIADPQSQFPHS